MIAQLPGWGLEKRPRKKFSQFGPRPPGVGETYGVKVGSKNSPVGSEAFFPALPIEPRNCKQKAGDFENERVRSIFAFQKSVFGPKIAVPQRIRRWAQKVYFPYCQYGLETVSKLSQMLKTNV